MDPLKTGDRAPDFALQDQHGQEFTLSQFAGDKAVLLMFYPFAFSSVCTGELIAFRDRLELFETDDTTLLTISCDPIYTQRAVADRDALFFPLLSDYWPHGEVTQAYGVFDERRGAPRRSSFVVGKDGLITWAVHATWDQARGLEEQAGALRAAGALV